MKRFAIILMVSSLLMSGCATVHEPTSLKDKHEWTSFPEPTTEQRSQLSHHFDRVIDIDHDENTEPQLENEESEVSDDTEQASKPEMNKAKVPQEDKSTGKQKTTTSSQEQQSFEFSNLEQELNSKKFLQTSTTDQAILVRFNDRLNFPPGKATLSSSDKIALDNLARIIGDAPVNIEIRGHTSNFTVESDKYKNRQELSVGRARSVMEYLSEKDYINQDQLEPVGYGAEKPLVPNTTPENRRINRRVDFLIREIHKVN